MIEHNVDYIQCSRMLSEKYNIEREHKAINGLRFYSHGYEDKLGVRYYYGNPNSKKALVIYSGRALHNHRVVGYDNIETINMLLSMGAKITRLDLCITEYIEDNLVTVDNVEQWFNEGLINSSLTKYGAKKIVALEEHYQQHTETLYIGNPKQRGSLGIFRAYDKGVELDLGKFMITRLEYEDRADKAHVSAKRLAQSKNIGSVFKTRLNVDSEQFQRICDSPEITTARGEQIDDGGIEEKNDKRWTWLLSQVAPSLRKAIEQDKAQGLGVERLQRFLDIALIDNRQV